MFSEHYWNFVDAHLKEFKEFIEGKKKYEVQATLSIGQLIHCSNFLTLVGAENLAALKIWNTTNFYPFSHMRRSLYNRNCRNQL